MMLRPFVESDVDDVVGLNADPEVMRFLNDGKPMSAAAARAEFPRYLEPGFVVASEKVTGRFLGWFGLRELTDDTVELGYRLHQAAWGRGLATEGSRALIDHGFATQGVRRVVAETMAVNTGSRRVMEKCGLRHVRTFFVDWPDPIPGSEHGEVGYELTREEWLASR